MDGEQPADDTTAGVTSAFRGMRIATRVAPGPPIPAPCRFFLQGFCANGDSCRFQHPQPNQDELVQYGHQRQHQQQLHIQQQPFNRPVHSPAVSLALSPNLSHPFTPPPPPTNNRPRSSTLSFAPPRMEQYVPQHRNSPYASHDANEFITQPLPIPSPNSNPFSSPSNSDFVLSPGVVNIPKSNPAPNTFVGFSAAFASVLEHSDDEDEADALLRAASAPRSSVPSAPFTSSVGAAHASTYAAVTAVDDGIRPPPKRPPMPQSTAAAWGMAAPTSIASSPHSGTGSPAMRASSSSAAMGGSQLNGLSMLGRGGALCRFHLTGECRYGERCRYVHGLPCTRCGQNAIHPTDEMEAVMHEEECQREHALKERVKKSEKIECNICYERPVEKKRKFGLLQNCSHSFCLPCIREWRGQESSYTFGRENVRVCPVCRTESFLVIPSDTYENDPAVREQLLLKYRDKLSSIPCKHFDYGRGECPFGNSCFYAHLDTNGNPVESPEHPQLLISDSGVRVKQHARLADYLPPAR